MALVEVWPALRFCVVQFVDRVEYVELRRAGEQVELGETNGTDGISRIGELGGMKLELVSASGTGGTSGWKWLIGVFSDGLDVSFGYKVLVQVNFHLQ